MKTMSLLVGIIFLISCENSDYNEKQIVSAIKQKTNTNEKVYVSFNSLTNFKWNYLYIFTPYTPDNYIYKSLGFKWDTLKTVKLEVRDDVNLLVFVKNKKVVYFFELKRKYGDFSKVDTGKKITPSESTFEVIRENHGQPWLVLKR